ncbi:MAG: HAMP domain-containing histidine kinase [Deltaproteobacteria bacterium]|nr:HAMP domain-containing histidine kinase [Deltaproteobacteria bacterium]
MGAQGISSETICAEKAPLAQSSLDVQRRLDNATTQLAHHTQELRRAVEAARRRARELADANARLRILDRLKTDFLAFICHELRTPLTHLSAIDLIDAAADDPGQVKLLQVVRSGYERFENFIHHGLEYFRWLSAERLEPNGHTDLVEVVRRVSADMPALASAAVQLRIIAPADPVVVGAEQGHVAHCVSILLDNAVKFSAEEKSVRVIIRPARERALLSVVDRGKGFPPELAQELFRPFTIADTMHHSAGSGLSLALASAIVQAYGGKIWAESPGPGQGAIFTMQLPVPAIAAAQ